MLIHFQENGFQFFSLAILWRSPLFPPCIYRWSGCISAMSHVLWPKIRSEGLLELQFERTQGRKAQDAPIVWVYQLIRKLVFASLVASSDPHQLACYHDIVFGILSGTYSDIICDMYSDIPFGKYADMFSDYLSDIHPDIFDMNYIYSHTLTDTYGDIYLTYCLTFYLTYVWTGCPTCYLIWCVDIFRQSSWHRFWHSMWHLFLQFTYHFLSDTPWTHHLQKTTKLTVTTPSIRFFQLQDMPILGLIFYDPPVPIGRLLSKSKIIVFASNLEFLFWVNIIGLIFWYFVRGRNQPRQDVHDVGNVLRMWLVILACMHG